jgi:polyhydroxybutyrate depolymerase
MSNGGGMALKLGLELTDRIAAVAVVSSGSHRALMTEHIAANRRLSRPFSFILSVGTADEGAYGPQEDRVAVSEVIDYFVRALEANDTPEETHWPATAEDPTSITRYRHTGGVRGTEVVLYRVTDGGHTWPGGPQYLPADRIGPVSSHLDQSAEIWRHFSRQTLFGARD